MNFSVVIATAGVPEWGELAWSRAYPSADRQRNPYAGVEVVIEHHPDLTVSAARNAAAANASGDYLVFLDADDELEPGYVEEMAHVWRAGAILEDWAPLLVPRLRYVRDGVTEDSAFPNLGGWPRVNECVIGTGIRRSCFEEIGGFREWPSIEDYDLFLRAYDAGAPLCYVEGSVYRAHVERERLPGGDRNLDQSSYPAIWAEHLARTAGR